MSRLHRITDGVIFQAVLTGSLSFSHIHDLAAAHGQSGWKAWLYPLSVDLLTVAAYRKLVAARRISGTTTGLAWCAFLLGLAASLAANVISAWQNPDRLIAVALGVWPAVAFLVCTLLSHDPVPAVEVPPLSVPESAALPAALGVPAARSESDSERVEVPAPTPARQGAVTAREERAPRSERATLPDDLLTAAELVNRDALAATGKPAGIGKIRKELRVGQVRAQALRDHLAALPADDRAPLPALS